MQGKFSPRLRGVPHDIFGLNIGVLGHKNTFEVSKEFNFFRVLLSTFCLDVHRAKKKLNSKNAHLIGCGTCGNSDFRHRVTNIGH